MCDRCETFSPDRPVGRRGPLLVDVAQEPMEIIGTDLCKLDGRAYLVAMDAFTGYPYVQRFSKMPSAWQVIEALLEFSELGFPDVILSDGGRLYESAEFRELCDFNRITHRLSSAHFPQSNDLAETAVKK